MVKSGWFRESHRHSLAARGVKTNRYFKQKQYFMGEYSISQKALQEIPDEFKAEATRMLIKGVPAKDVVKKFTGREDFVERETKGFYMPRRRLNTPEDTIRLLRRMGEELGRPPNMKDVDTENWSISDMRKQFGSFPAAVQAAADRAREETPETVDDARLLWYQGKIRTRNVVPAAQRLGISENSIPLTEEEIEAARARGQETVMNRREEDMKKLLLQQQVNELEGAIEDLKRPFVQPTPGMDISPALLDRQKRELQAKESELRELKEKAKDKQLFARKKYYNPLAAAAALAALDVAGSRLKAGQERKSAKVSADLQKQIIREQERSQRRLLRQQQRIAEEARQPIEVERPVELQYRVGDEFYYARK